MTPFGEVSPSTALVGGIGHPIQHSLSPVIYNAAFRELDMDWLCLAFDVTPENLGPAISGISVLNLRGLSVTMPHKETVMPFLDEVSVSAGKLRAVNSIVTADDRLVGHNTDGQGFIDALKAEGAVDPAGSRFVVLGSGGAARAVIFALAEAGAASVSVLSRRREASESAAALAGSAGRGGVPDDVEDSDVVINATPVGMAGTSNQPDSDWAPVWNAILDRLTPAHLAVDLVYAPRSTIFLQEAERRGARTLGGLGMLVHQAAHSFGLWTGQTAPISAMKEAVERVISTKPAAS